MKVTSGAFERQDAKFRGWAELPAAGRYHLYVALACPWSHRAVIALRLKGLEAEVGVSYLHPYRDERGWAFTGDGFTDPVNGWEYLAEAYEQTEPGYDGRISVPVLWDKETGRIVSNESHDIMRMFNAASPEPDLYPAPLRDEIDRLNERIYATVNNGVYLHFRCNGRRIVDHPNLWAYARDLYQRSGIAATVAMDEIKTHYYTTHDSLNPKRIVPAGPLDLDWTAPHGRDAR
jgi:putative glutathione S-transferase